MIQGRITVHPDLARHVAPGDRLLSKLFHPKGAMVMDAKFQIIPKFELPMEFRIAPALDMSRRSKWQDYVLEVFTDKDQNVLGTAPGELIGRTPEAVPLGTSGVVLELNAERQ